MYDVRASALRFRGTVEITVTGLLADSCVKANIKDFYPGGSIVYVRDPGFTQVFIKEWREENSSFCTFGLVPWVDHVRIPDTVHGALHVFINGSLQLETPIIDLPEPKKSQTVERIGLTGEKSVLPGGDYIVIASSGPIGGKHHGCRIIPEGTSHLHIFKQVYGPAKYSKCTAYVEKHCDDPILFPPRGEGVGAKAASAARIIESAATMGDLRQITPGGPGVSPWPGGSTPWPGPNPWPVPWPNPPFPYPPYPSPPWPPYPWPPFPPTPPIPPWPGPGSDFTRSGLSATASVGQSTTLRNLSESVATVATSQLVRSDVEDDCYAAIKYAALNYLDAYENRGVPFSSRHVPAELPTAATEIEWGGCYSVAVEILKRKYDFREQNNEDTRKTHSMLFRETSDVYLTDQIMGDEGE